MKGATRTVLVAGGLGVFLAVWVAMPSPSSVIASNSRDAKPLNSATREPTVEWRIAGAVKQLRIVTSVIDSRLIVRASDDNWRGEASATIEVPVRAHFGVDLATLPDDAIRRGPDGATLVLRVPKPRRLSVEVRPEIGKPQVQVGWGRWKSWAGEQMLADARKRAVDEAQHFIADADEMKRVRAQAAEQIESLVKRIAGPDVKVRVEFAAE